MLADASKVFEQYKYFKNGRKCLHNDVKDGAMSIISHFKDIFGKKIGLGNTSFSVLSGTVFRRLLSPSKIKIKGKPNFEGETI